MKKKKEDPEKNESSVEMPPDPLGTSKMPPDPVEKREEK